MYLTKGIFPKGDIPSGNFPMGSSFGKVRLKSLYNRTEQYLLDIDKCLNLIKVHNKYYKLEETVSL